MFKNLKLGTKLILVGLVILLIPLATVGYFAVEKASEGLAALEDEQLAAVTATLAQGIDNALEGEAKVVLDLSVASTTVEAAEAVSQNGLNSTQAKVAALNEKFRVFSQTQGLRNNSQVVFATNTVGKVIAASDPSYLGISAADRPYFKDAISGQANIGKPELNKVTNQPFVPIAAPIYADGKPVGVVVNILDIGYLNDMIVGTKTGKTGYTFMADKDGIIIAHPDKENVLKLNLKELNGMEEVVHKMIAGQSGVEHYVFEGIPKTAGFAPVKATGWGVCLSLPDEEFLAPAHAVRNIVAGIAVIFFCVAFVAFFFFARSVTKALRKGVDLVVKVADGDLTADIDVNQKKNSDGTPDRRWCFRYFA